MTDATDVANLRRLAESSVKGARQDLGHILLERGLLTSGHSQAQVAAALREIIPALTYKHSDTLAAQVALWYEDVRRHQVQGRYSAVIGNDYPLDAISSSIDWAIEVYATSPSRSFSILDNRIGRWVNHAGRSTVKLNTFRDRAKPRWARVPAGALTCSWCLMLAGRGWVYATKEDAGAAGQFHDSCDCQIVPSWDKGTPSIPGVGLERFQALLSQAEMDAARIDGILPTTERIMKELKLSNVTSDSVVRPKPAHEWKNPPAPVFDLSESDWNHVLYGENDSRKGGHLFGVGRFGKTEFPESWDEAKIRAAVLQAIAKPQYVDNVNLKTVRRAEVDRVIIEVVSQPYKNHDVLFAVFPRSGDGVYRNDKASSGGLVKKELPIDRKKLQKEVKS